MSTGERRLAFGPAADLYDRVRPSYPEAAIRFGLGHEAREVADVGAGTGIFTRLLLALGHRVIAIEPDEGMRRKLVERTPGVEVLAGSAESIPLQSTSIDAVTAAQAHHWFAQEAANGEIARVLRPSGVFVIVWNVRDESVEWVAELARAAGLEGGSLGDSRDVSDFGPAFNEAERAEFVHSVDLDAETLLDLVRSRSQYIVASAAERRKVDASVRALTSELPERFDLTYITHVVRASRR